MKSLLVRDLDDGTLGTLKRLARFHNRSLQGELHEILERAAKLAPGLDADAELELVHARTNGETSWTREEIYSDEER